MTRRDFLAGATGATAALLLGPHVRAAEAARQADPHCFALLSDTHVPANPKKVQAKVNMTDHFIKAIDQVVNLDPAPAGAIFCGDLAHISGLPTEYKQFAPIVSKLAEAKLPTHLMVGNHDHIENLYSALNTARPAKPLVVGKHVSIVQSQRANWFLLDSLEIVNNTPGLLGAEQLKWLGKALDEHANKPAIVMAHHDPSLLPPKRRPKRNSGLKDGDALLDVLVERNHVKAFIYGHRHHWRHRTHGGLHIMALPTTAYTSPLQASSWVLARLERTGLSLELRAIDPKHALNGKKIELTWRP
jgi:3',5'-cyclic AMP phosphodiesterase CpdA